MRRRRKIALLVVALAVLVLAAALVSSCTRAPPPKSPAPPPGLKSPYTGYSSAHYKDPSSWLCLPGRDDACARNLDATELRPDGSRVVVRDTPAPGADKIDCFYVYPTVDWWLGAGNHEDFASTERMQSVIVAQAARFRSVCRLYAPFYRQVTLGTYFRSKEVRERYFEVAESDVVDAFLHYMGQENKGRKIVLLGHSQGGQMVVRLLQRFFDDDRAMRERLLLAMPIGWPVQVPKGKNVGATFSHLPICQTKGETGCVVAYRSYVAGSDPSPGYAQPAAGNESACVNPRELAKGAPGTFSRSFVPVPDRFRGFLRGVDDVTTPFVMLRDFYRAECVNGKDGFRYLAVSEAPSPGDQRAGPIDLGSRRFRGVLGLHILDYQFAQGDLVDLVGERAALLSGP